MVLGQTKGSPKLNAILLLRGNFKYKQILGKRLDSLKLQQGLCANYADMLKDSCTDDEKSMSMHLRIFQDPVSCRRVPHKEKKT